jgi:hypothetical protein
MIESVFNVRPLAARETSSDVGNLLSAIDLNRTPRPAPVLPMPQPVIPQTICSSSFKGAGVAGEPASESVARQPNSFQKLQQAALERGWQVY